MRSILEVGSEQFITFFILAVLIVSGTGPFIGYHTGTNRMLRRTAFAKYLAVRRLAFTLKNIPASTGRIASSFHLRHMELLSRIVASHSFFRRGPEFGIMPSPRHSVSQFSIISAPASVPLGLLPCHHSRISIDEKRFALLEFNQSHRQCCQ